MNKTIRTVVAANNKAVEQAARMLAEGQLVGFPTETVYGLGADATHDTAIAAVFEAKGRPHFNPLIIHVTDADMAARYVDIPDMGRTLMNFFWPGGLSLVMPRLEACSVSLLAGAGLDTLAVRCPSHPVARRLIAALGKPIAAPSANISGAVSPTRASHVAQSLGAAVTMILDGGPCEAGIESTVIDVSGERPTILRPGATTQEEIEAVIGPVMTAANNDEAANKSPGMMERHYAPTCPLRMNATMARDGETLLGFGPNAPSNAPNLSRSGDMREAAANLFAMLRELEQGQATAIAVMPIPETGLGRAINDRLGRAAVSPTLKDLSI